MTERVGRSYESREIQAGNEVEIDDAEPAPLPEEIVLNEHTKIEFTPVKGHNTPKSYSLKRGGLVKRQFDLFHATFSTRTGEGDEWFRRPLHDSEGRPTYFTGTRNGFFAHDPFSDEEVAPENDFALIGIHVAALERNPKRIVSVYHEIGHARLFTSKAVELMVSAAQGNTESESELAMQFGIFGEEVEGYIQAAKDALANTHSIEATDALTTQELVEKNSRLNEVVTVFEERWAWYLGINAAGKEGRTLMHSSIREVQEWALRCLATYNGRYGTNAFTRGFTLRGVYSDSNAMQ